MITRDHKPRRPWEKLDAADGVVIDGVDYRVTRSDPAGQLLREVSRPTVDAFFDHATWEKIKNQPGYRHHPGLHDPNRPSIRSLAGVEFIGDIPADQLRRMRFLETMIFELERLHRAGKVKLTPKAVQEQLDGELGRRVREAMKRIQLGDAALGGRAFVSFDITGSALLKKRRDYKKRGGFAALRDGRYKSGNPRADLQREVAAIIAIHVQANLTGSLRQVHEDIEDDIDERNADAARKAALAAANGDAEFQPIELLRVPDIKTVAKARSKVDPFRVAIATWGKDAAVRLHPAVRGTVDVQEALGRIEYDESVVDVITLLTESGVWALMTKEERAAVRKGRMVIGVAICVVTKCILAMRIYPVGNAAETVATIRMITEDKTRYVPVHLRDQLSWHQCGGIGGVTVDQGSSNISDEARTVFANLDVPIDIAPAANPQDRGAGERIFRTFASAIYSLLDARTGFNVVDRRQYRPEGRASLTLDELWAVLVIGIVGIYHNSPHGGLGGRTPADEWERVTADYGIRALPDPNRRRVAFGRRKFREVTRNGVTYGGLSYTNPLIDHHYLHRRGKLEVVGDPEDLGAVSVKIGAVWYEALCTDPDMVGVRLEDWLAASATQKDIADEDVRKRKAARRAAKQALRAIQEGARGRAAERPSASIEQLEEAAVQRIFGKYEHADEDQPAHDGQLGIAVEPDNDVPQSPAITGAEMPTPAAAAAGTKAKPKWKMK
ncbi:MAG: hypothetical protein JNL14_08560 [Devosia sp.]|uniref:hypothetical protein n=1 Tax=Devosia sp. TaxID=1871048 RepID=UPI001A5B26DC|nr:hypothetical protein [Devosia sp.]MBL8597776.1 hypothetical protein [Devosia sp.]